jgi:short-subunit dehydrogenase
MPRPLALITGASSGIGAALAAVLAGAGYDLVLTARRASRLDDLAAGAAGAGASSEVLPADLSSPDGLQLVADRAAAGDIDLLISNAGVSAYGSFADLPLDELARAWRLNAEAAPLLTRLVLPGMLQRRTGGIITVASGLALSAGIRTPASGIGHAPSLPQRALYVGAKAGLVGFTRTLAAELQDTGVRAMVVCPGMVSSEWNGGAFRIPAAMTPEDVARATWAGYLQKETICFPGLEDTSALDRFTQAEQALLAGNHGPQLAARYA